jgi:7-carboxy-7-deazaguanine synthase
VIKVVDIKTPGSGEMHRNFFKNIIHILPHDQIKFVICHKEDYEWSKHIISEYELNQKCQILFSPSYEQLPAEQLADWILADRLKVRFQMQLHKILWGDVRGK